MLRNAPHDLYMCMVLLFSGSLRFSPCILFLRQVKLVAKTPYNLGYGMGVYIYR